MLQYGVPIFFLNIIFFLKKKKKFFFGGGGGGTRCHMCDAKFLSNTHTI